MKRHILRVLAAIVLVMGSAATVPAAGSTHGHNETKAGDAMIHEAPQKAFTYETEVDGVKTEIQIMSLASMNMTDPNGATHHVMVKLFDGKADRPILDADGRIKVIAPDGAQQTGDWKNYSGVFAANFAFEKDGNYGIICLFKVAGKKHLVKFWYPKG